MLDSLSDMNIENSRDLILHKDMPIDERNAELERLRRESEALTEWEEEEIIGG